MRFIGLWSGRLPLAPSFGEGRYYLECSAAAASIGIPLRWLLSGHETRDDHLELSSRAVATARPRLPWPPRSVVSSVRLPRLEWQYSQLGLVHLWTTKAAPPTRLPFILTILDAIALSEQHGERGDVAAARELASTAAAVTTLSTATAAALRETLQLPHLEITAIGAGVDRTRFTPRVSESDETVLRRHGLQSGYLLYIGGWAERKGLSVLSDALAMLDPRSRPVTALSGIPRPGDAKLVAALQGNGARMLGYVPDADVPALMRHACALVLPTLAEGFGLPVIEAQACGIPVVCTDLPVLRDVSGGAALFVPPGDASAMADALRQSRASAAELRGSGGRNAAGHTWEAAAGRLLEVYRSVVERSH